jgi:O-antigen ligase
MASSDLARGASSTRHPTFFEGPVTWAALASLAIAFPTLIAFNVPPSATFLNQAAAFVGWGGFLLVLGTSIPRSAWPRTPAATALLAAMALLLALSLAASMWRSVPWSISLSAAGTIASAILAIAMGAAATRSGLGEKAFTAVCIALVVAGVACSAIGLIQVFMPGLPDGDWIAPSAIPGRATGNLRQPNHLSSILLWSIVAAAWLGERRALPRAVAAALAIVFVWGVMLAGSRTGAIGILTLAAWGALDRRLSRSGRLVLLAGPLAYALLWWATSQVLHPGHQAIGAGARFSGSGPFETYTRFSIWSNALALAAMHPWVGVGFGEFNFAWTLTPFPTRPNEFFDHAHDLVLQFAAELGVPLTLIVLLLFAYAVYQALRNALADGRAELSASRLFGPTPKADTSKRSGSMQRAAFVIVLMAGIHSMLEYPLWYSYFLLPTAFVFGLCLERAAPDAWPAAGDDEPNVTRPFVIAAMLLMLGGSLAVYDYMRVVVIFAPPAGAGPLEQRIAAGRKSVLFSHHAAYAEATTDEPADESMSVFASAPHYLLDSRLLIAWAKALDAHGETDKARHIAARLKEFHNPSADEFFAPCNKAQAPSKVAAAEDKALPFQCQAPTRVYRYEDFL